MSASSHTNLFPYEAIFHNSILKAIFALTRWLGKDSLFHTWPLSPRVRLVVLCQSFAEPRYVTAMPSSLGNCMNTEQALTLSLSDLKPSYHIYFLCKDKVPIANPSQQATDLFPWDPSKTNNHQETAIKSRSSTWMVRDRAAERSNDLSLSCTSYSHILKASPVRRNFITALTY